MATIDQELTRAWERLENESDQAWEAFQKYLELGTARSLAKTAQALGKSAPLMEGWSARHGWLKRVLAYDRHASRQINTKIILDSADMRSRQINLAQHMQLKAAQRIINMTDAEIKQLTPAQAVMFFKISADAEFKARQIPAFEMEGEDSDFAPNFTIQVITLGGDGMIGVRLTDGRVGYIATSELDRFKTDYPEAVVIQ